MRSKGAMMNRHQSPTTVPRTIVTMVIMIIAAMGIRSRSARLAHKYNQRRYTTGNKKIQTRSTKCQKRPPTSMRLMNCSGLDFHILAPGKAK